MRNVLLLLLLTTTTFAETVYVSRVIDGDTIEVDHSRRIRMLGYNTPERGEKHFYKATWQLALLVFRKHVELEVDTKDRYGRELGVVKVHGNCVNSRMRLRYPDTRYDHLQTKRQVELFNECAK